MMTQAQRHNLSSHRTVKVTVLPRKKNLISRAFCGAVLDGYFRAERSPLLLLKVSRHARRETSFM